MAKKKASEDPKAVRLNLVVPADLAGAILKIKAAAALADMDTGRYLILAGLEKATADLLRGAKSD